MLQCALFQERGHSKHIASNNTFWRTWRILLVSHSKLLLFTFFSCCCRIQWKFIFTMSRRSARLRQKSSPPPPPAKPPTSVSPVSSEDELEKLYRLSDNWLELESDPGVFTLLVNDFGCTEVEIEEIYDINLPFKNKVFGFIFLFNYTLKNSRSRHSSCLVESGTFITDETFLTEHFFAHQIVPNSCATHALLSVLLNCADIEIGASLSSFKVSHLLFHPTAQL